MNERIRDFALQTDGILWNDEGNKLASVLDGRHLEVFTALIVQECAMIGKRYIGISEDQVKFEEDLRQTFQRSRE